MNLENPSHFIHRLLSGNGETFEPSMPDDDGQVQELTNRLQQFLLRLQQTWWKQQVRFLVTQITTTETMLDQITRWVEGKLPAENIALLEQQVAQNEMYQAFYADLQSLYEQLQEVDRFDPGQVIGDLLASLIPTPLAPPTSPTWSFRGGNAYAVPLAVADEFDFTVQLFVGGFDRQRRLIRGQLSFEANSSYSPVIPGEATVWLLPAVGREWYSGQVDEAGQFELGKPVPPGAYTFEMAWPSGFLEVFDVLIPMD